MPIFGHQSVHTLLNLWTSFDKLSSSLLSLIPLFFTSSFDPPKCRTIIVFCCCQLGYSPINIHCIRYHGINIYRKEYVKVSSFRVSLTYIMFMYVEFILLCLKLKISCSNDRCKM